MNLLKRLFGLGGEEAVALSYEEARELARHEDPAVRRTLAARADMRPEILYFLAEDPNPEVRREIAVNTATPAQANLLLATDSDAEIRTVLAAKIARLAPGLTADEQDRLRRMTYEALELLARDQVIRVRRILAEALADVANAPPELIRRLAGDAAISVAGPVLENSPVLTDEDLLDIIQSSPIQGALSAISRRTHVGPIVADAIAATDDCAAIAVLLANPSAQIREETLDHLIERAPDIEIWHDPLVHRPQLSARAAARLARFVADNLLQNLHRRRDLDPETTEAVAKAVRRRLDEQDRAKPPQTAAKAKRCDSRPAVAEPETPYVIAGRMNEAGTLDEKVIAKALTVGDNDFVIAALAVRAGLPLEAATKVIATQSAKGITALTWKARLTMAFAVQLQTRLARISPPDLLHPKAGKFPLTEEDMAWQLDLFVSMAVD